MGPRHKQHTITSSVIVLMFAPFPWGVAASGFSSRSHLAPNYYCPDPITVPILLLSRSYYCTCPDPITVPVPILTYCSALPPRLHSR